MSAAARRLFDRATLLLMVAGLALLLQPWWIDGFRVGFFTTLAGVLLQTVAGHLPAGKVAGQLHHAPPNGGKGTVAGPLHHAPRNEGAS